MKRQIKFEKYETYVPEIRKILISHARNPDYEAIFSIHDISPSLHITKEDIPIFEQWMINKAFVKKIECIGTDLFRCTLNEKLLISEI